MEEEIFENEIISDNQEIVEDIKIVDLSSIVVYSRDWTIETIFNQIHNGNIDLNPKFQRRNAWNDYKRSLLIESVLAGYPVPEIVLAEDPIRKKSFVVIDGKQRLLTIAGYIDPDVYNYWDKPKLPKLALKENLHNVTYQELKTNPRFVNEHREFLNATLRCTIITNFKDNDILYDIFYRLNSGSVPLSTQELRQVLNRGEFANYLISTTNEIQPIHLVMKLKEPDKRLRDIEILLRSISMILFHKTYNGNLKVFLDKSMMTITNKWDIYEKQVNEVYYSMNKAIEILKRIFNDYTNIGRKFTDNMLEKRFNIVLFEVEVFYFIHINPNILNATNTKSFMKEFMNLCQEDFEFRSSIESSTKNIDNYRIRFTKFQKLINTSFGTSLDVNPFKR